jgi:two-component system response regulator PilR (NtrC family)
MQISSIDSTTASGILRTVGKESRLKRVLVVDDELLIRWSLTQTLRDHGCDVVQADTAAGALATVKSSDSPFDFAFVDLRLPDSHDLTLLAALRQMSPKTAIVLMSAFASPEIQQTALALGALHVIAKPFEMDDIPGLLKRAS